jgi:hypothetical protein
VILWSFNWFSQFHNSRYSIFIVVLSLNLNIKTKISLSSVRLHLKYLIAIKSIEIRWNRCVSISLDLTWHGEIWSNLAWFKLIWYDMISKSNVVKYDYNEHATYCSILLERSNKWTIWSSIPCFPFDSNQIWEFSFVWVFKYVRLIDSKFRIRKKNVTLTGHGERTASSHILEI